MLQTTSDNVALMSTRSESYWKYILWKFLVKFEEVPRVWFHGYEFST